MSAWLGLFRIEARRNMARWMALVIVAVSGLILWNILGAMAVLLWTESSVLVRGPATFVAGPLIAGAAAWMAGRERRSGIEELLVSVPFAEPPRRIITWAATSFWGIIAAFLVGAAVFAVTAWRATWGEPVLWPGVVGVLALTAYAAAGYVLGVFLPSRFVAPLVAISVFVGQDVGVERIMTMLDEADAPGWLVALSPVAPLHNSAWYGVQPEIGLGQSLFFLGLTGLLLALLTIRKPRDVANHIVMMMFLVPTGVALASIVLLSNDPNANRSYTRYWNGASPESRWSMIPHEPVCAGESLPVCVHPAYRPVLADLVPRVARMAAPLAGLPGVPSRVEQMPSVDDDHEEVVVEDGVISLTLSPNFSSVETAVHLVAHALVYDHGSFSKAQAAIQAWLLRRAGLELQCDLVGPPDLVRSSFSLDECTAAERFARLDPAEQRRWLEENYAALREGRLSLEALP